MDDKKKNSIWSNGEQAKREELHTKPLLLFASLFMWLGLLSLYVVLEVIPHCDADIIELNPNTETVYLEEYD